MTNSVIAHRKGKAKPPKVVLVVVWGAVILTGIVIISLWFLLREKPLISSTEARAAQIYPNYTFEKGVVRIKVPLIPLGQVLSRKAGGWVITPAGSEFRSDYEVPIIIEYIDGRKFHREPRKPAWDQVRPANSIFRLYGKEGEYATVTIKRGVY